MLFSGGGPKGVKFVVYVQEFLMGRFCLSKKLVPWNRNELFFLPRRLVRPQVVRFLNINIIHNELYAITIWKFLANESVFFEEVIKGREVITQSVHVRIVESMFRRLNLDDIELRSDTHECEVRPLPLKLDRQYYFFTKPPFKISFER